VTDSSRSKGLRRFWLARGERVLFTRPLIIFSAAVLVCLVVLLAEVFALGGLRHGRLLANALTLCLLLAGTDLACRIFRSGWIRLSREGYRFHQPWSGERSSSTWQNTEMAAIVPGEMVKFAQGVALLLVTKDGSRCVLEYRPELIRAVLHSNPALRIAALPENPEIRHLLRQLDQAGVGWLPLTWVERNGGTELVLKQPSR